MWSRTAFAAPPQTKVGILANLLMTLVIATLSGCQSGGGNPMRVENKSHTMGWEGRLARVHREGDARPRVPLAEIPRTDGTFAIGPLAGLRGEITVIDGEPYIARINDQGRPVVTHDLNQQAPFLVYGTVRRWRSVPLPDRVQTVEDLESWLGSADVPPVPFPFKITTARSTVGYHIINNTAPGYHISRPHRELMQHFELSDIPLTLLGVYSTEHGGVFTHMGASTHIHVATDDGESSGHVDTLELGSDAQVYLPAR